MADGPGLLKPAFPALWLSLRAVWVLLGLAFALALASVVPYLLGAVVLGAVVTAALIAADALLGPSRRALRISRRPLLPLALRRPAAAI